MGTYGIVASRRRDWFGAIALTALCAVLTSCGSDGPRPQSVSAVVGPAGATVVGPGGVQVAIPAGAVQSDFTLTVSTVPSGSPPAGNSLVATPLSLTPKSQTFDTDVAIVIPLSGGLPAGSTITDVVVLQGDFGTNVFTPIPTAPAGGTSVSVSVLSLGDFVTVVQDRVDPPFDGSVGTDAGLPPTRFLDMGDGTVLDSLTSLRWQKAANDVPADLSGAATGCAAVTLPPSGAWRLPTVTELNGIVDRTRVTPALDPVFTGAISSVVHHTSTPYAGTASTSWRLVVETGDIGVYSDTTASPYRCVTGVDASTPAALTVPGGVVIDTNYALVYQQVDQAITGTYIGAADYCRTLTLSPYSGFRVPTLEELVRLVDYTRFQPVIESAIFTGVSAAPYWTSTTYAGTANQYWTIDLGTGAITSAPGDATTPFVMCVIDEVN